MNVSLFKRYLTILFIVIGVLSIIIFKSAFKNGIPTCNNYVINVYLYLALGISFVVLGSLYVEKLTNNFGIVFKDHKNPDYEKYYKYSIISFLILLPLIIIFALFFHNVFMSHILYLVITMLLGVLSLPLIKLEKYNKYVDDALLGTGAIFIFMTILYYLFPKFFTSTQGIVMSGLIVGLFVIILINIINAFFLKNNSLDSFMNYVALILFSIFVSYDTSLINTRAKLCVPKNVEKSMFNPNYPSEALNFVLDIMNIFQNLLSIYGDN